MGAVHSGGTRLGRYVDLTLDDEVIGITSLRKIKAEGNKRHQIGVVLEGQERRPGHAIWYGIQRDGMPVGQMTCGAWSPRAQTMIGYGLVSADVTVGDSVDVIRGGYSDPGTVCTVPFF